MAGNPKIQIDIVADGADARKEVDKTAGAFDKFGKGLDKAAGWSAGAGAALVGFGVIAVDAAKDAELAATSVDRAFGTAADRVHAFADNAAESVGISSAEYESLAATFGTAVQGMGLSAEEAAGKTDGLLTAAGDLALAAGTDVPTAASALGAALRGEYDALSEFGVKVDDATVLAGLAAKGITDPVTGLAPAIGSAQFQQELLNQVMGLAGTTYQGYRAETDTTTERTDLMTASFDDAKAKLGEALLPMLVTGAEKLTDFAGWVKTNADTITAWLPWIALATGAIWLLNFAMALNPIILFIAAIAALIAVFVIFHDKIQGAMGAVDDFLSAVDNVVPGLGPAREIVKFMSGDLSTLTTWAINAANAISDLIGLWNDLTTTTIAGTPSMPAAPPPRSAGGMAVPGGVTAGRSLRAGGQSAAVAAGGTSIVIQAGVGDPDAIARAVQRVLIGRARRSGPVIL